LSPHNARPRRRPGASARLPAKAIIVLALSISAAARIPDVRHEHKTHHNRRGGRQPVKA
jgi:hypothetical protein